MTYRLFVLLKFHFNPRFPLLLDAMKERVGAAAALFVPTVTNENASVFAALSSL